MRFFSACLCVLIDSQFPSRSECTRQYIPARRRQANMRVSHLSPAARNRQENLGCFLHKRRLLLQRKHQISVPSCLRGQRSKFPAPYTKSRQSCVGVLLHPLQAECNPAKVCCGHQGTPVDHGVSHHHRTAYVYCSMPVPLGALLTSISVFSLDRKWRDGLAGGEVIEGAKAAAQLVVAQAVLAIQRSEKLLGGALRLFRVAIHAASHQVAVAPRIARAASRGRWTAFYSGWGANNKSSGPPRGSCMAVRNGRIRRKSSSSRLPAAPGAGAGRSAALLAARTAGTSKGSHRRTTCWAWVPRSTKSHTPRATRRRTASRAVVPAMPAPRASQVIENRNRSLPSRRLCRKR
jgi:hypothetical protein